MARQMMRHHQKNYLWGSGPRGSGGHLIPKRASSSFKSSKSSHGGRDPGNIVMKMIQIISQEDIERRHLLDLQEEMSLREERLLCEETRILRHQQMEKEDLILGRPCRLRGQLDEGI